MITTTAIAPTTSRIGMVKRDISPSAARVFENVFDFLCDIEPDAFPESEIDSMCQLIDDLKYLDMTQMNEVLSDNNDELEPIHANNWQEINEGQLKAKASHTAEKIRARKWYKANKSRVKKMAMRLKKSKGLMKKKIRKKAGRTLSGREKREYDTDGHEAVNLTLRRGSRAAVNKLFENKPYRVIKSFSFDGIEAGLNEKIEYVCGTTWILSKRDGSRYKIEVENNKEFTQFLKNEADVTLEDFV